ncbi:MAG: hypothetical protein OEU26_12285 [Candidatus Tectomicrobia bacterium]|nr:hypothetical protein [Candidatus Tectomicrobia bacterium]
MKQARKRMIPMAVAMAFAALMVLVFAMTAPLSWADENAEAPFPVGRLFFQLNDTDEDLGIHLLVDGEPWRTLEIDDPRDQRIFNVRTSGKLRRQGLTEFKFESAEPDFEQFPAELFFQRFPEGEYDIEAKRLDGTTYESEVVITHLMPAPPARLAVNGAEAPEDCDEGPVPVVSGPFVISWEPVEFSHPEIGAPNNVPIRVVRYEVAVERDEPTFFKMDATIDAPAPPGAPATSYEVPASLFSPGDLVKFQVLVQGGDETGTENETSSESCFIVSSE